MKYRSVSTADVAQTFARIVTSLSKQTLQDVVIRFTDTDVYFLRPPSESMTVLFKLACRVRRDQIFNEYKMEGFSREENEIYLKLDISSLKKAVTNLERTTVMTIKLEGSSQKGACFFITLETGLTCIANSRKVIHEVPITVISHRKWHEFEELQLPNPQVTIKLKNPKNISKMVDRLKMMDKSIDLVAVRDMDSVLENTGKLQLLSGHRCVGARVSTEFTVPMIIRQDLVDKYAEDGDDGRNNNRNQYQCKLVVDIKLLQQFLSAFATANYSLQIDLREDEYAKFTLDQYELEACLILPNFVS